MSGLRLPLGWATASLEEICDETVRQAAPQRVPVAYIDISSVDRDRKELGTLRIVTHETAPTRARQWIEPGDVLVSMTRPNLNAVALVGRGHRGAVASTAFHVLRPRRVLSEWVFQRVRSQEFIADVCRGLQGVVYPAIRPHDVRRHQIPIAPLPEQHRVIAALESYFTRLDDTVATLERVRRNLTRYRTLVLKAAVEGRLVPTEAELARAEGREYEPASALLNRILAERRRRWEEAELAGMSAIRKVPTNDGWKDSYQGPKPPELPERNTLPQGWCWSSIEQLGEVSGGITKHSRREQLPQQLPYLRVANVYANELRLEDISNIGIAQSEVERALLKRGDLLVVEGNGSIGQIGRVAIWDGSITPCVHQNHLIKVRFPSVGLAEWSLAWLLSPGGRSAIERVASSTSGLHTLSLSKVERLPVPIPPLAEQLRIKRELDRLTTVHEATLREVNDQPRRCEQLRQSILKWAFEGKLVDQDLNDEPAFVLLDRIRAEREAADNGAAPRLRRRVRAGRGN